MKKIQVTRDGRPATKEELAAAVEGKPLPPVSGSAAIVSRDKVMAAESALMKAANEFGRAWGCDQTAHPRSYWLELHIERWSELARCALAYAECFEQPPND